MLDAPSSISVDALVFDAYGTLFDVHSIAATAERMLPNHAAALSQLWRTKQLEYTWLESLMASPARARQDFAALTAHALDYALGALNLSLSIADRGELLDAYLGLAPFPDVPSTLRALAPRPRWILSNGTQAMLAPLVARSGLAADLDGVISVDDARIFKPSPRVYQLAVDRLGVAPSRIGFVSSNCWDAIGAKAYGLTVFWINRGGVPVDRHGPAPDRIIGSLRDLPPLLA